jgi:hypothetical protein
MQEVPEDARGYSFGNNRAAGASLLTEARRASLSFDERIPE